MRDENSGGLEIPWFVRTKGCTAPFNWLIKTTVLLLIAYHDDVTGLKCIQVIYAIVSRTIRLPTEEEKCCNTHTHSYTVL